MSNKQKSIIFLSFLSIFTILTIFNFKFINDGFFYLKNADLFIEDFFSMTYFLIKILVLLVIFFFAPVFLLSFLTSEKKELFESQSSFLLTAILYLSMGIFGIFYLKSAKEPILTADGYVYFINLVKQNDIAKKTYLSFDKGTPVTFSMFVKVKDAVEEANEEKQKKMSEKIKLQKEDKIKKLEKELEEIHNEKNNEYINN